VLGGEATGALPGATAVPGGEAAPPPGSAFGVAVEGASGDVAVADSVTGGAAVAVSPDGCAGAITGPGPVSDTEPVLAAPAAPTPAEVWTGDAEPAEPTAVGVEPAGA
jgi:hypothetical protein